MKHNLSLDGVRALAVLEVLAFHCRVPGFAGGFLGVDVFFVLSGFLITTMLAKESAKSGTIQFRRFYAQRVLRLAPALAAMLVAYVAFASLFFKWNIAVLLRDVALAAFYLSDYSVAFWYIPNVIGHAWSLSVEEHYYLLWPLVLSLALRLNRTRLIALLILLYFADMAWRDTVLLQAGWQAYYRFDTRLTGLLLGGIIALSGTRLPSRWTEPLSILGLLSIMLATGSSHWLGSASLIWGIPTVEMASGLLILGVLSNTNSSIARLLAFRPIAFIGTISYAIYLWHYPIARLLRDALPWYQTLTITLALSLSFATASYFLIERPINKWRKGKSVDQDKAGKLIHPTLVPAAVRSIPTARGRFSPSPPRA